MYLFPSLYKISGKRQTLNVSIWTLRLKSLLRPELPDKSQKRVAVMLCIFLLLLAAVYFGLQDSSVRFVTLRG